MLKIKFNIKKFTIIFSEKIGKKINSKKLSTQPSLFNFSVKPFSVPALFFFQLQHLFLLLFSSGQRLFLLLFSSPSAPLFFFLFFCFIPLSLAPLSSFLLDVLPFFYQPKNIFFSPKPFFSPKRFCLTPKYFFSSAQKYYFQPKTFLHQPKILFQFSPKISPCLWFSASFFLFLFCLQPLRIALFQPKCLVQNLFQLLHVSLFE